MPSKNQNNPGWIDALSLFQQSIGSKFVIPIYQRNYVRDAKKQVKTLLDDYCELIGNDKNHFLGIVLDYLVDGNSRSHTYYIIDGQQRLITIFLIIAALKHRLSYERKNDEESRINLDQLNACLYVSTSKHLLKLEPLMSDGNIFKKIINEEYESLNDSEKDSKIAQAYSYIRNFVNKSVDSKSVTELMNALNRLQLVEIPLDNSDDAQQIFESINYKGCPLTSIDLIRNYVLMCTNDDDKDTVFNDKWRPFEYKFNDAAEFEKFFRFFMMNQNMEFVKKNDVYTKFRQWLDEKLIILPMCDIIDFLSLYANSYETIYKKDLLKFNDEKLWKCIKDFRNIKSEMPIPLVLEFFVLYSQNKIENSQLTDILETINSFILRRAILGMDTSGISRFFTTLIKPINSLCDEDYSNIVDVVRYCIVDKNDGKASRMPNDADLINGLEKLNVYDNHLALHCFFDKYENEKITSPINTMNYQIEHIMPQNSEKWIDALGISKDEYEVQVNRFGNLTLTTKHDNPKMSNNLFEYKQAILKDTAHFRSNLSIYQLHEWNVDCIETRNKSEIEELIRLYPIEGSVDKSFYEENLNKLNQLPEMIDLIESGTINIDDKIYLGKYKENSEATLKDVDKVIYMDEELTIKQRIYKFYGLKSGINMYKEIHLSSSGLTLEYLRIKYKKEIPTTVKPNEQTLELVKLLSKKVSDQLHEILENRNDFELLPSRLTFIRFAGLKTRKRVGLCGDGSWEHSIKDLIAYEIHLSSTSGCYLSVIIGPGDNIIRQKWLNFCLKDKLLKPRSIQRTKNRKFLYYNKISKSRSFYAKDEAFVSQNLCEIKKFFDDTFDLIENKFANAPQNFEDPIFADINMVYDENYHLEHSLENIQDLYQLLKIKTIELFPFIESYSTKFYTAYKLDGKILFDVEFFKSSLKITFSNFGKEIFDPLNKCRDISKIGTHGTGNNDFHIKNEEDLNYFIQIITKLFVS